MIYIFAFLTILIGCITFYFSFHKRNKTRLQSISVLFAWLLFVLSGLLWIGQANLKLKKNLDYLYETNQVERKCGVFKKYMYLGAGRNGKSKFLIFHYQENSSIHSLHTWCTYHAYQACDIQNNLIEGEKICITFVQRPSEKISDLYEIQKVN